jgi:hypothetical protein
MRPNEGRGKRQQHRFQSENPLRSPDDNDSFDVILRTAMENDDLLTALLSLERDAIAPKGANGNATRQNVA